MEVVSAGEMEMGGQARPAYVALLCLGVEGGGGSRPGRQLCQDLLGTGVEAVSLSMSPEVLGAAGNWASLLVALHAVPCPLHSLDTVLSGATWGHLGSNAATLSLLPVLGSQNGFLGLRPLCSPFPLSVGWSW